MEFFFAHTQWISALHTVFGGVFILGALAHFYNNFKSVVFYLKDKISWILVLLVIGLACITYFELPPFSSLMNWGTQLRAGQKQEVIQGKYEQVKINANNALPVTIDLVKGKHYWHPQMVVWTEDTAGNFLETVFVSKATAKGLFYGGRSKENFKSFDTIKDMVNDDYRRVDALPVWSHSRNVQYPDGLFVPPASSPLPDAITGATLSDNFILETSMNQQQRFKLKIEINVAFDDNEFYSEYDFPDDETFHAGTGQLGQPSIVFEAFVDLQDGKDYYLMELIGHGHHSGQNGEIYKDLSTLTTALDIVERIVVGVDQPTTKS